MAIDDFKTFYATRLRAELEGLEVLRRKERAKAYWGLGAVLALVGYGIYVQQPGPVIVAAIGLVGVLIWSELRWGKAFRAVITPKLLGLLGQNIFYDAEGCIPCAEFMRCGLFHHEPDNYTGSDYLQVRIGEVPIRFSQVNATYEEEHTTTDSDGRTQTEHRTVTIFSGVLFTATFNKVFHGTTRVLPRSPIGRLGAGKLEVVKLEDPVFHRFFDVFSTDQIEARYLLSTSLMQRLLSLAARLEHAPLIAFIDGQIYIALTGMRLLRKYPSLFSSRAAFLDPKRYEDALGGISDMIKIVDDLNLNRRIWAGSSARPAAAATPQS